MLLSTTWEVQGVDGPDARGMLTVWYRRQDGDERRGHRFPADTLLWRAAEYGIPATDAQALLDVVLHEPFISGADWTGPAHMPGADHEHPHFLYNCPDQDTACAHHLGRIASAKSRHAVADPDGLLAAILGVHRVDEHQAARERHVAGTRAVVQASRGGAP